MILAAAAAALPEGRSAALRVALLLAASLPWAGLVVAWRRGQLRGWRAAVGLAVAARLALAFTTPVLSDDVYRYAWEGRVQQALGAPTPYLMAPDHPDLGQLREGWHPRINHPHLTAIYFPAAQAFFRATARGGDPVVAVKMGLAAVDGLAVLLLALWLRRRGRDPGGALVYGACPLVLVEVSASGHVDALLVLALVGALWLGERFRGRWGAAGAGAALALGALVKPTLLLPAAVILAHRALRGRRAALLAGALAATLAVAAPYLPAGRGLTRTLSTFAGSWRANDPLHSLVLGGFEGLWAAAGLEQAGPGGGRLYLHLHVVEGGLLFSGRESVPLLRWGDPPPGFPAEALLHLGLWPETLARGLMLLAVLAVLAWLVRAARAGRGSVEGLALAAIALPLLLSPTAYPWYWLPAAALLPLAFSPGLATLLATLPLFYLVLLPAIPVVDGGPLWLKLLVHAPALIVVAWLGLRTRRPGTGPAVTPG